MHKFCGQKVDRRLFTRNTDLSSIIVYEREDFVWPHAAKDLLITSQIELENYYVHVIFKF